MDGSLDLDVVVNTHMTEMNLNNDVIDIDRTVMMDSQFPTTSNINFAESIIHNEKLSNDGSTGGHPVKQMINQNSGRDSESKFYEQ